jgi:hypothetical protein
MPPSDSGLSKSKQEVWPSPKSNLAPWDIAYNGIFCHHSSSLKFSVLKSPVM